jgi:hypothetical protein
LTHLHITVIVLTILLFLVAVLFQKQGRDIKILQMVLRFMYLLVIATGTMLFSAVYDISFLYILKALLGLGMIGLFEMVLAFGGKRKNSPGLWVSFAGVFIGLLYLGLKLPMGFYLN